jgi:hypothetical protein
MNKKKQRQILTLDDKPLAKVPLKEYPRPQFVRDSYICFNGEWDFEISSYCGLPTKYNRKIIVPFVPESLLSGVNTYINKGEFIFYRKKFNLSKKFVKDLVFLHIDASDQFTDVYINGHHVASHSEGYLPLTSEIHSFIKYKDNELVIRVRDDLSKVIPYGKQSEKSHGMWYTKFTGIWKSVWLESVNIKHFENLQIRTNLEAVRIRSNGIGDNKKVIIHTEEGDIINDFDEDITIKLSHPHLWSPDDPYLYNFELISDTDHVKSYFALRTIEVDKNDNSRILFNGKPIFFHGLLDQGYWPDGIVTPKSYKYFEKEIKELKALGFNTLRKHIKVEPLYFYYLCDKLGMFVFQDMVNNNKYSIFKHGIPPVVFEKIHKKNFGKHDNRAYRQAFAKSMEGTVSLLSNSPCVVYYTIFNEGWGQTHPNSFYEYMKQLNLGPLVDSTSGWYFADKSDVYSYHIYFRKLKLYKEKDIRPKLISEFGGYVYKIPEHSFNLYKTFGYKIFKTQEEFQKGFKDLYMNEVIPLIDQGLQGAIYTQVSDVEDETNGLFTYDRKVLKVNKKDCLDIKKTIDSKIGQ